MDESEPTVHLDIVEMACKWCCQVVPLGVVCPSCGSPMLSAPPWQAGTRRAAANGPAQPAEPALEDEAGEDLAIVEVEADDAALIGELAEGATLIDRLTEEILPTTLEEGADAEDLTILDGVPEADAVLVAEELAQAEQPNVAQGQDLAEDEDLTVTQAEELTVTPAEELTVTPAADLAEAPDLEAADDDVPVADVVPVQEALPPSPDQELVVESPEIPPEREAQPAAESVIAAEEMIGAPESNQVEVDKGLEAVSPEVAEEQRVEAAPEPQEDEPPREPSMVYRIEATSPPPATQQPIQERSDQRAPKGSRWWPLRRRSRSVQSAEPASPGTDTPPDPAPVAASAEDQVELTPDPLPPTSPRVSRPVELPPSAGSSVTVQASPGLLDGQSGGKRGKRLKCASCGVASERKMCQSCEEVYKELRQLTSTTQW